MLPGDVAGPALRVTVRVKNATHSALTLSGAAVNLYYGKNNAPASPLSGSGARAFPTKARAGGEADAVYVFRVPPTARSHIRIEFDLSIIGDVAIFQGAAA